MVKYLALWMHFQNHLIKRALFPQRSTLGVSVSGHKCYLCSPRTFILKWLILHMNNINCVRACSEIPVIQAISPPVCSPGAVSKDEQAWNVVTTASSWDAAFRRLYTFTSLGVCQPSVLNYISHQKCCQMQSYVSRLWSICWCCGVFKFESGGEERSISQGWYC